MGRAATAGRNLWYPSGPASSRGARHPVVKRSPRSLGGEQVEGRQAVRELLAARRRRVDEVWMTEGSDPSPILGEIDRLARDAHVPVRLVSARRLESVQGTDAPQGVVAYAEPLEAVSLDELVLGANSVRAGSRGAGVLAREDRTPDEVPPVRPSEGGEPEPGGDEMSILIEVGADLEEAEEPAEEASPVPDSAGTAAEVARALETGTWAEVGAGAFLVLLEGVTDPQNLGAILRSAECAGAGGVALPRHRAVHVTPAVTKAAAGAIEYLRLALVAGVPSALQDLERLGVMTVGLDERGSASLDSLDLADRPVALVLGSEGSGLSPLARRRCDVLCRIPLAGEIPSLNVSAAAAVACFEVARQRRGRSRGSG